ncbi:hypothetical protein F5141DRAFT_1014709 [Pisolithus sp. B1]|nr:hypothetical protein F5141DRAFT_1014709 [Pisolithus sp. B1]
MDNCAYALPQTDVSHAFKGLVLWICILITLLSGHCLLLLDEQTVLISNLLEGMDLYRICHCHPYHRFKYTADTGDNLSVQVTFLHDGCAVACGSMDSNVTVWDVTNEDQIQVLPHDVHPPLLTVVQAYQYRDFMLLATGMSHSSKNMYIQIWCSDTSRSAFSLSTDLSHFVLFL